MTTNDKEKKSQENKSALFIPTGLVLGMGCGFIFDNVVAGLIIGLGIGMVVFAILKVMKE